MLAQGPPHQKGPNKKNHMVIHVAAIDDVSITMHESSVVIFNLRVLQEAHNVSLYIL